MMDEDLLTPAHLATVARVRGVCTAAGIAGAVTSMAANMLASDGTVVGLAVGVIAPGAFILASEIASAASSLPRTTGTRPLLATLVALLLVIGVSAAVVSFGHIREVVASVGESATAEVLIAIVVDAVAVMGLVGHRLTGLYLHRHHAAADAKRNAEQVAAAAAHAEAEQRAAAEAERARRRAERAAATSARAPNDKTSTTVEAGRPVGPVAGDDPSLPSAERARAIAAANPDMTRRQIAEAIGMGERTVRRYLNEAPTPTADVARPGNETTDNDKTTDEGREAPGLVAV
ncbi:MAG: hypothetical protein AAGK32_14365 [Actinomycetota bacterium]